MVGNLKAGQIIIIAAHLHQRAHRLSPVGGWRPSQGRVHGRRCGRRHKRPPSRKRPRRLSRWGRGRGRPGAICGPGHRCLACRPSSCLVHCAGNMTEMSVIFSVAAVLVAVAISLSRAAVVRSICSPRHGILCPCVHGILCSLGRDIRSAPPQHTPPLKPFPRCWLCIRAFIQRPPRSSGLE